MKSNRWIKVVALIVILAMVLGGLAAGIFVLLGGSPDVQGTYKASDGRTMVLKSGTAKITVPDGGSASAPYKVSGDTVVIEVDQQNKITLNIEGKNLVIQGGGESGTWVRQ